MLLEKIHFFLPRIPKVTIALFKDNLPHMTDDDDGDGSDFSNFNVKIQSTYTAT